MVKQQIRVRRTTETPPVCEVCATPLSETDHLLCPDCSRVFTIVLELLREPKPAIQNWFDMHSELTPEDLSRISQVFRWRNKKIGLGSAESEIAAALHPWDR